VIMTCMNALHSITFRDEEVVRDDYGDMLSCRKLKSHEMYHGLPTVCVCFMHNTPFF
jgi:hypothetical protein